jgi:site-specific DNA-methyltransferase (cytosine-N4-specific)
LRLIQHDDPHNLHSTTGLRCSFVEQSRLPYGKQLSPNQIDLRELLELARDAGGDTEVLDAAIGKRFFPKPGNEQNERTSGMNARLSMRSHGLITADKPYALTPLAEHLLATETTDELKSAFATHLLLEHHGIQFLEVLESLQARGEKVNVAAIVRELNAIGIDPGGSTGENVNPMRLWLAEAGVLKDTWTIDSAVLKGLIGATPDEISEMVALPRTQQAFLRAMATVTDLPPLDGAKIRVLAEIQTPGVIIDVKTFAPVTLKRLEADGWISVTKTTGGRGAKPHQVVPTQRFKDVISEPLMNSIIEQVHLQDPAALRRPLPDLLAIVNDEGRSNHERGMALEGVCIQIARLSGARFLGWRLRGDDTSGAEVDVVAETVYPPYQIIQIQSKASPINGREIVDREVGVSAALKSNVILFVSAKKIGPAARKAAASHMQESSLSILFLDSSDLTGASAGAGVGMALAREWERVRIVRSRRGQERAMTLGT